MMSRSYRKPILKDKNGRFYNKLFRRINKIRIQTDKYPLLMKEIINDYDVCDWILNLAYKGYTDDYWDITRNKIKRK